MINRALKAIRLYYGLTQAELALKLGISKSYLSEIESGAKTISYNLLEDYSHIFDIPVSQLVFFSETLGNPNSVPERFRLVAAEQVIRLMDWVNSRNGMKID